MVRDIGDPLYMGRGSRYSANVPAHTGCHTGWGPLVEEGYMSHVDFIHTHTQLVCATEKFTNRYISLDCTKSVPFSALYHY